MPEATLPKKKLSYIPSLDGMRGVYCIIIVMAHWQLILPIAPLGWEVLQIFFIMSGFLIGRILVVERERHDTFKSYIKSFYIKRSLRIFPLYFLFIGFWLLLRFLLPNVDYIQWATQELADYWGFYLTYTSNLKSLFFPHSFDAPFFAHLWSLGVEEQFYLVMPFMIFFFRGRSLKIVLIAFMLFPFLSRTLGNYLLMQHNDDQIWAGMVVYRNLLCQTDAFAIGTALAVFDLKWIKHPKRLFYAFLLLFVGLTFYHYMIFDDYVGVLIRHFGLDISTDDVLFFAYIKMLGLPELLPMGKQYIYMMPLVNILGALTILCSIRGNTLWPKLYNNKYMIEMGKVTYAMYIFHFCGIMIMIKLFSGIFGRDMASLNPLLHIVIFIVYMIVLFWAGKFSFKYIETPFLKIKSRIK